MTDGRVLVLDDEAEVGETIALLVESEGHDVRHTTDPEEFLRLAISWQATHLVIDLRMPGMDGIDVLGALARAGSRAAVLISSGVGNRVLDAAARYANENGLRVVGVLPKPFGPDELRKMLAMGTDSMFLESADEGANADHIDVDDLKDALRDDGLDVVYQPKVRCETGELAGFEVLARWSHPQLGAVAPMVFVPLAERSGLIDLLTERVLSQALRWFARRRMPSGATLAVNISALSLTGPGFVTRLTELCEKHGVPPTSVILELTETSTSGDPTMLLQLLTQLRMQGFHLSLDDFGTGYSSMSLLARLPFSEIKIDRSFVTNALTSEESRTVVKSVIDLGHSLGLTTAAEGVEDEGTLQLLRELGSDLAQGYHIARPMGGDEASTWGAATPG